jgi:hypothetical protein
MAHFAQIDENNIVQQVIVVHNNELLDKNGDENENLGSQFCSNLLVGNWLQTSYNRTIRKNYAGVGDTYDADRDAFYGPQPYPSWTLNEDSCIWEAPTSYPADGAIYKWNESTTSWDASDTIV